MSSRSDANGRRGTLSPVGTHVIVLPGSTARVGTSLWHTAEDAYVPPEHTYCLAASLAAHGVPHAAHVFAHGPHSLGLAQGNGDAAAWTTLPASWIAEQQRRAGVRDHVSRDVRRR